MEEKRREATGSPSPATGSVTSESPPPSKPPKSPATEPIAPRRRGQKRKSTASTSSLSSSAPPKRHAREKAAAAAAAAAAGISALLPPFHNGPLTRARQLSDTNAVLNAIKEETARDSPVVVVDGRREEVVSRRNEEFEAFQAKIEAELKEIRSRDKNCHVVPVAAGWFSWGDVHPLEKQALPSFFSGKSENRTPEMFMEIRNWLMKRFHANPCANIELKDLSDLSCGDADARQEVMEFLDYWGLINYHPFPQNESANLYTDPNTENDKSGKTDSLIEKLYKFENEQSCSELVPRANLSSQATPAGLLRESAIADEFIKQEGPAVEYHCNSCSADCSRKRYHCQKQADFDLCTECFINEKFGSGMSSSDFILMEPGEASGATGGKWTDQETLLLLEALELFKENWNEIAEHVATKTKAQCILHFLQMPIEDSFLDDDDNTKAAVQKVVEQNSTNNEASIPKDNYEPSKGNAWKDNTDQAQSKSSMANSEPEAAKSAKEDPDPSASETDTNANDPASTPMEISIPEKAQDVKLTKVNEDEVFLKALTEAFNAVGCPVSPQDDLCFAEAANSVMALAAFLSQLVEPSLATASARVSLKLMSENSPGSHLATSHCFILEDPPDNKKDQPMSESMATEKSYQNTQRDVDDENGQEVPQNEETLANMDEEKSKTLLDGNSLTDDRMDKKNGSQPGDDPKSISGGKGVGAEESQSAEEVDRDKAEVVQTLDKEISVVSEKPDEKISQDTEKLEEKKTQNAGEPNETSQVVEKLEETANDNQDRPEDVIETANDTHTDPSHLNSNDHDDSSCKVILPPGSADGSANLHSVVEVGCCTDAPKDVDMESNCSDKLEQKGTVLVDPVVGVGTATGEDKMEVDKIIDPKPAKTTRAVHDNGSRLERAALATLSAAAVKAKLLANQEEDEIKQLAAVLIEKQLRKLEIKLSFFTEMESSIMRVREQLERPRQKLFAERAQIIASRLGLPATARGMPSSHPLNRMPAGLLNSMLRPQMNMRPPLSRPVTASAVASADVSALPDAAGNVSSQPNAAEIPPSADVRI